MIEHEVRTALGVIEARRMLTPSQVLLLQYAWRRGGWRWWLAQRRYRASYRSLIPIDTVAD